MPDPQYLEDGAVVVDRELLRDVVDLLDNARCDLIDPDVRRTWGQRRRRVLDQLREAVERG